MKVIVKGIVAGLTALVGSGNLAMAAENETAIGDNTPVVIHLWDSRTPQYDNGLPVDSEVEESAYWISNVTKPELYVYPAANPNGKAMLMCPGGGYVGVAISHEGKELAPLLNDEGITLAVLKYRVPNGNKNVPAEDVYEALRILNQRADQWGIDPGKIGIGGASAGGHLASTVATHLSTELPPLYFQVLFYPVITMEDGVTHAGSKNNLLGPNPSPDDIYYYSNETQVSEATAPAFIMVSADDEVVPMENSQRYFKALQEKNSRSELHVYPTGGHGWGTNSDFTYASQWRRALRNWLRKL